MSSEDQVIVDKVVRRRSARNDHTNETIDQEREDDIPEELMTKLEDHVGDGGAKITIGGSLGSTRDYHKAECFVSISVSCNNDMDDVDAVHGIVLPYIHKYAEEDLEEMSKLRDPWLEPQRRLHERRTGKPPKKDAPTSLPPAEREKSAVKKPPKRSSSIKTKNKGVKMPSFRR